MGSKPILVNGSTAMSTAVNLAGDFIVAAYPITPQTLIVEYLSKLAADGKLRGKFYDVESEHSAPSFLIGSALKGKRTFTATASQGLLYMMEPLFNAAGLRIPMVMGVSNRSVSAPLNIHNDQQDSISARDSGWMQHYVPNNQSALDGILIAYRVAEKVGLPCMVCMDGFNLSHLMEPVEIPEQEEVDRFLPPFNPLNILDPKNPKTIGYAMLQEHYMGTRKQMQDAMRYTIPIIKEASEEFEKVFGRPGPGILDAHNTKDADIVLVSTGSVGELVREVLQGYRGKYKIGHVDLRFYRPFPGEDLQEALGDAKVVGVIERNISIGHFGAIHSDLASVLAEKGKLMEDYILGLGGKNMGTGDIQTIINDLVRCHSVGRTRGRPFWIGEEDEAIDSSFKQEFEDVFKDRKNIIFHGRGGQGAMTGANLLSFIMFGTGKATQAFPTFGPERQGAPMMAFTRVDSQKIGDRSIIQSPNLVIVLDPSLLPRVEYTGELAKGGVVIVNYNGSASDLKINPKYKVYAVDASGISNELFKRNFPNSPLVGAAARILGVDLATIESRVNEFMPKEKEKNAEAARRGYHSIK